MSISTILTLVISGTLAILLVGGILLELAETDSDKNE